MPHTVLLASLVVALALVLLMGLRPDIARSREGRILAFLALFLFPACAIWAGFSEHMALATSTRFCLSCHVMRDHGKSLRIDDPGYLPAAHYQNNRVPRDQACYTCHTTYTMFGTFEAKMKGLRHLTVQYLGTVPRPADVRLYEPYNNRECLHCHLGARRFEESRRHQRQPDQLKLMKSGKLSCLAGGCHEIAHDIPSLANAPLWAAPSESPRNGRGAPR